MDAGFLTARFVHIALGTFWAGAAIFNAVFLAPAVRDAGPDGAKVMAGLLQRNFLHVMPVVAALTVLSGIYLLYLVSGSFSPAYMGSRPGIAFSLGMLAGVVAFGLGIGVMRPAILRAAALGPSLGTAAPADGERLQVELQALRARAAAAGQAVAWLLGLSVLTMAVARYL